MYYLDFFFSKFDSFILMSCLCPHSFLGRGSIVYYKIRVNQHSFVFLKPAKIFWSRKYCSRMFKLDALSRFSCSLHLPVLSGQHF